MHRTIAAVLLTVVLTFSSCVSGTSVRQADPLATIDAERATQGVFIGLKKKVAVLDFENKTSYGKNRLGDSCSDILMTELGKSGRVILLEREKLGRLEQEQELQRSGSAEMDPSVAAGKTLGANAIVTGSISQFGVKTEGSDYLVTQSKKQIAEATVDMRVIDVASGRVLWTDTGKGMAVKKVSTVLGLGGRAGYDETLAGEALRAAIVKFVRNIMEQIDKAEWTCYVAESDGGSIYLDAGSESGLSPGTVLKVTRPGKAIKSPSTGLVIGYTENHVGTIEVVSNFGDNGSIANKTSGETPAKGDICKLSM